MSISKLILRVLSDFSNSLPDFSFDIESCDCVWCEIARKLNRQLEPTPNEWSEALEELSQSHWERLQSQEKLRSAVREGKLLPVTLIVLTSSKGEFKRFQFSDKQLYSPFEAYFMVCTIIYWAYRKKVEMRLLLARIEGVLDKETSCINDDPLRLCVEALQVLLPDVFRGATDFDTVFQWYEELKASGPERKRNESYAN